jgi:hypothetical protein
MSVGGNNFIRGASRTQGRRREFKSGVLKRDSRAERAKKYFVPHFHKYGGTSKQIIISIEYTEIGCLFVALINII